VRLEAEGSKADWRPEKATEWGHVVGWGENPEQQLGDLTDLFDLPEEEQEWQERALCAQTDPEAFFPEKGGSTREAKRICLGCEVKDECLEYALAHDERFGIWGGLSERERRKLKKRAV
jgi:WhiB family redox-sensing transcriptional regulator